jgi:uncharacterized membrane protein (UPF0182 family)
MEELFKKIGSWLFLIGILMAIIVGLVVGANYIEPGTTAHSYASIILAALGFVVGILTFFAVGNITQEKVPTFLLAALLLVGIGTAGSTNWFAQIDYIGTFFTGIATMLAIFVAPAAGLLAIRAIWDAGKTKEIEKVIPKIPR